MSRHEASGCAAWLLARAEAVIERVRELHRTGPGDPTPGGSICWGCGGTWPCPTIKVMDGEK